MIHPVKVDYGRYRKFGFKLGNTLHCGHDYDCKKDEPVRAIQNGIIYFIGQVNGFGGFNPSKKGGVVLIKHDGIIGLYGHIKYNDNLRTAMPVKEGDVIGYVDDYYSSGISLPHLHFAIYTGKNIYSTKWGYVDDLTDWKDPLKFINGQI